MEFRIFINIVVVIYIFCFMYFYNLNLMVIAASIVMWILLGFVANMAACYTHKTLVTKKNTITMILLGPIGLVIVLISIPLIKWYKNNVTHEKGITE